MVSPISIPKPLQPGSAKNQKISLPSYRMALVRLSSAGKMNEMRGTLLELITRQPAIGFLTSNPTFKVHNLANPQKDPQYGNKAKNRSSETCKETKEFCAPVSPARPGAQKGHHASRAPVFLAEQLPHHLDG